MNADTEHREWLERMVAEGFTTRLVADKALWVWDQIQGLFGVQSKVPAATCQGDTDPETKGLIHYFWYSDRIRFELEIYPDGHLEWFIRDKVTEACNGGGWEELDSHPPPLDT